MDYNGAQRAHYRILFNRRFKTAQKLFRRRIAVAVCKQLTALFCGHFHCRQYLAVSHCAVAAVAAFFVTGIRRAHPCRFALRRPVQKYFYAPDAKVTAQSVKLVFYGVIYRRFAVCRDIRFQNAAFEQRFVKGQHLRYKHSLLNACNAVGKIFLLRPFKGAQHVAVALQRQLFQIIKECVFLHVSREPAAVRLNFSAALPRLCFYAFRDAQQP